MGMKWKLLLLVHAMFLFIPVIADPEATKQAAERAKNIQKTMYSFLRDMALPGSGKGPIKQRFVLQIPGKLLNPNDYDSRNESADATIEKFQSTIPPKIGENMYRLTDIKPAPDPIRGGETGESFFEAYEKVLNGMYVRDYSENKEVYEEAIKFLGQKVPDPNGNEPVPLFDIYKRLQERYNNITLEMETVIESKRKEFLNDPIEYQIWFQNNYPPWQARVENAYTEWIVFGQKDRVESYKAKLDTTSIGHFLGKAKTLLRSSGKMTQDRASTYYPVYFEPSNWYMYLYPRNQPPTREELQVQIGDLEAKITTLESIKNSSGPADDSKKIAELEKSQTASKEQLDHESKDIVGKKFSCISNLLTTVQDDGNKEKKKTGEKDKSQAKTETPRSKECDEFFTLNSKLHESTRKYAADKAQVDNAKFQLYVGEQSRSNLDTLIEGLKSRKITLENLLTTAKSPDTSEYQDVYNSSTFQDIQNGWMEFEFDSAKSAKDVDQSSSTAGASVDASFYEVLWGVSGGASYSRSSTDFAEKITNSNVKIKGKLLKVTIKRPWFQSQLFYDELIRMKKGKSVSPGSKLENEFIRELKQNEKKYLLPEFASAFLLAKDVEMEFSGIDASTRSHAVEQSASGKLSGHYLCFSASASADYGSSNSRLQTESTVDGLKIKIPGAQLIGYYSTLLPCFPHSTSCLES